VIAEDLGGDVGVRGAADVEEQAGVVRLRRGFGIHAKLLAKPHRNQCALQPMLERDADPEVRRQG